jgi:MFS family permease
MDCWAVVQSKYGDGCGASDTSRAGGDILAAATAPIGMQGRYLATFQLSLASAATITPALAGSLLAANPRGLWLLLALLMVGAATLIVLLERVLPVAALRTARRATMTRAQQEAGDLECPEPCMPRQLGVD